MLDARYYPIEDDTLQEPQQSLESFDTRDNIQHINLTSNQAIPEIDLSNELDNIMSAILLGFGGYRDSGRYRQTRRNVN